VHDHDVVKLAVFVAGVALGVALFVPLLRILLRTRHDVTMAALTGLMAGSLRALWPWKTHYDPKTGPLDAAGVGAGVGWVLLALCVGCAAALALERLERRMGPDRIPPPTA
jgi:putative membrane protein